MRDDVNVGTLKMHLTNPDEVEEFVSRTGVDSLAVRSERAMGPLSLSRDQKPQLRFDILAEIEKNGFRITHRAARLFIHQTRNYVDSDTQIPWSIG